MIFYTNFLVPAQAVAITLGPIILIRPEYRGHMGILVHELVHVRQWKESWGLFWPRYLISRRWRRHYEVEAYREQLKVNPYSLELFATYLSRDYNLGISRDVARSLLLQQQD